MPDNEGPETGPTTNTPDPDPDAKSATDWRAETDRWKSQARENERRAKANAKELEQLKQASMSDQEKAVALARTEARIEALREVGAARVDDAVRLAVAGRDVAVDALLEGLDRNRFVDENGQPDTAAVQAWVDRLAPPPKQPGATFPDLGQGARGPGTAALNGDPLLNDLKSKLGIR